MLVKRLLSPFTVLLVLISPIALAQEAVGPPQMLSVFVAHTKIGHQVEYETAVKTITAALKETGSTFPVFVSQSLTNPGDYSFVSPISGFGDMDNLGAAYNKAFAHTGPIAGLGDTSTGNTRQIIVLRPDLSYQPATARLADGEGRFGYITWLYVRPPNAPAVAEGIKKFAALNKKHGIKDGYNVYQSVTGDGPVFIIRGLGKSRADYFTQAEMNAQKTGDEAAALRASIGPMLDRIEYTSGVGRPDLGYQP